MPSNCMFRGKWHSGEMVFEGNDTQSMKNPVAPDALLDYLNCGCKGACNTKKSSCYNASKISVCERLSASI